MSLRGGSFEPLHSFPMILGCAQTLSVAHSKVVLGVYMPLFSGSFEPLHSFGKVLVKVIYHHANDVLSIGRSLLSEWI